MRERRDFEIFADAAKAADLGLGDIQAAAAQKIAPAPASEFGFAAGDIDFQPLAQKAVAGAIFGRHRLLEPIHAQAPERAPDRASVARRVAVIGVDHQPRRIRKRGAHRLDQADVFARPQPHFHLDGAKAARFECGRFGGENPRQIAAFAQHHAVAINRHPRAAAPADQAIKRHPGGLAEYVPQRDVDAGQALLPSATLPGPKHSPQPVIPSSVLTSTRCAVRES